MMQSKSVHRRLGVLAALALGGVAAACGGGASPVAPGAVSARGAVIRGTVQGQGTGGASTLGASSALHTSSSAPTLKVSVVGTPLSTSTDAAGQFVLSGVPTGRIELRFEGPGLDARLEIGGLADGQEISITVRVNGGGVVLVSGDDPSPSPSASPSPTPSPVDDDEAEFNGRLDAIDGTTLTVAGRTVLTDANTKIRQHGDAVHFSTLQVGQTVEVEGSVQSGGSVLAKKVTIEDDNDDDENEDDDGQEVEFEGSIQSISGSTLMVSDRTVLTDGNTEFRGDQGEKVTLSFFKVGDHVEVEGHSQSGDSILAKNIKAED